MKINKKVSPAFEDFVFDWDYERYLLIGGYGSGKSYHIAFKIILKLLEEKRKCLVVRQVFDTIYDSCYDLFKEILDDMGILTDDYFEYKKKKKPLVLAGKSPLRLLFPNGSQVIFKGMDNPEKVKSINGVSIVWIEECSEVSPDAYKELLGRIRTPNCSMHFILSCNPINVENWVYTHFFRIPPKQPGEKEIVVMDEEKLYEKKCIVKGDMYYHHSIPSDNPWLPWKYIRRLDELRFYDYPLYMVARWGRFGVSGTRVLPQFTVARDAEVFRRRIEELGPQNQYFGFDFGFEESFNAVISMSVDSKNSILYIWDEIYKNHVTDDIMAADPQMLKLKKRIDEYRELGINKPIIADNEDPKAIQYYRQTGYYMRATICKHNGSRLSNTRKIKRFKKIVCSPKCKNTIKELSTLAYAKDKDGKTKYDEFNIDPHSFSAIWYGLDKVTVADVKFRNWHHKKGA